MPGSIRCSASAIALVAALGAAPAALAQTVEEIVVTAQKKEQALQSVPVSVSAFTQADIEQRQIDEVSDLQFSVPNMSFARTNFASSNLQIRGITSEILSSSADSGIAIHMDDHYIAQPRLNDSQYFDVERIEVLRGPQGTLYGRNASGGSINVITRKPVTGEFSAYGSASYGDYDYFQVDGAVNVPIGERAALRVSGIWTKRDGFTENVNPAATFSNVDGRDIHSIRAAIRFEPTDATTLDVFGQYFREKDSRMRGTKQLCDTDPTPILGCTPTGLGYGGVNTDAEVWNQISALRGVSLSPWGRGASAVVPQDLRKTFLDFKPRYEAKEWIFGLRAQHELTDSLTLNLVATHHDDENDSRTDFNNSVGPAINPVVANMLTGLAGLPQNGLFPLSSPSPEGGDNRGLFGGYTYGSFGVIQAVDQSRSAAIENTAELRLTSDFDHMFNFMVAGFYHKLSKSQDYQVSHSQLDALAIAATRGAGGVAPFFRSETAETKLKSWSVFGEMYLDLTDNIRLTQGLRYTNDDLGVRSRLLFLSPLNLPYEEKGYKNEEITGRAVLDWKPDLSFTDATLVYASYSRGYKGGGFNPPVDRELFPHVALEFSPEYVNAFEFGTKNTLAGGKLQANLTAFYYDYQGLQVEQVVAQTAVTQNVDTKIWGLEAEFIYAPSRNWRFNAQFAHLNTKVGSISTVDARDPTAGRSDLTLLKQISSGANCVIFHNGNPAPTPASLNAATGGAFRLLVANGQGGVTPGVYGPGAIPGVGAQAALLTGPGACSPADRDPGTTTLGDLLAGSGYTVDAGAPVDLSGNELENSPNWTAGLGAQYTRELKTGYTLQARVDYHWQSGSWAKIFNHQNLDKLESWQRVNAQVTLNSPDERWYARAWVKNLTDEDVIVGTDSTDPTAGIFTNVFLLEPRQFGVTLGAKF